MPAFTNFLGLYKPGGGSTGLILPDEVVDIDRINSNMDAIDLFAKGWGQSADRNHQFYGPAASLAGVTGMKLGDTYQESDGNKVLWKYDGSNWITNEGGMYLVRPASVSGTGVSIGADGSVVFTAVGTVNADILGVFSSRFRNYKVISQWTAKPGIGIDMQFLTGATPVTSADHFLSCQILANGTRQDSNINAATKLQNVLSLFSGSLGASAVDIIAPNEAVKTQVISTSTANGGVVANGFVAGGYEQAAQHTGVRVIVPAGSTTGTMKIYGYA